MQLVPHINILNLKLNCYLLSYIHHSNYCIVIMLSFREYVYTMPCMPFLVIQTFTWQWHHRLTQRILFVHHHHPIILLYINDLPVVLGLSVSLVAHIIIRAVLHPYILPLNLTLGLWLNCLWPKPKSHPRKIVNWIGVVGIQSSVTVVAIQTLYPLRLFAAQCHCFPTLNISMFYTLWLSFCSGI